MTEKNKISENKVISTPEVKPMDNNVRKWDLALKISFGVMVGTFFTLSFILPWLSYFTIGRVIREISYILLSIITLSNILTFIFSIISFVKGNKKIFIYVAFFFALLILYSLLQSFVHNF